MGVKEYGRIRNRTWYQPRLVGRLIVAEGYRQDMMCYIVRCCGEDLTSNSQSSPDHAEPAVLLRPSRLPRCAPLRAPIPRLPTLLLPTPSQLQMPIPLRTTRPMSLEHKRLRLPDSRRHGRTRLRISRRSSSCSSQQLLSSTLSRRLLGLSFRRTYLASTAFAVPLFG